MGSWNTMAMSSPRTRRISASESARTSRPFSSTRPPVRLASRGVRRMIDKALTLLPEPDSPTSATVSPGATENETPCTTSRQLRRDGTRR